MSRPKSVVADFGPIHHGDHNAEGHGGHGGHEEPAKADHDAPKTANEYTHELHSLAGNLALIMVILGCSFSLATYYYHVLDPAESQDHFPGLHRFLWHKWYFDELYNAIIVRPGLAISQWCAAFDRNFVDGLVNLVGRSGVKTARVSGHADRGIVDGLVNIIGNVWFAAGTWLKNVQTGCTCAAISSSWRWLRWGCSCFWPPTPEPWRRVSKRRPRKVAFRSAKSLLFAERKATFHLAPVDIDSITSAQKG